MTQDISRSIILPYARQLNNAPERLSRLQAGLVSEALRRAVDDAGAAMAHQLSEPLTALLLYLHEIKRVSERRDGLEAVPASMREVVDMALRETERVCNIIERIRQAGDTTIETGVAVTRGCDAIEAWAHNGQAKTASSALAPHSRTDLLTPREREVLALIIGGSSNKEGGRQLEISTRTFEAHRAHLMAKLGAKNAADLIRLALNASQ
jgi:DNA-binding CsgD family transcriptional regulator